jgi:hypothetical protein
MTPFAGFTGADFDFMASAPEQRTWDQHATVKRQLSAFWDAVMARLSDTQRAALGRPRMGTLEFDEVSAWIQTHDGTDGTNLTVELWGDDLQLDLVAWRVPQAELFRTWLARRDAPDTLRALADFTVVVFVRRAVSDATGKPFWRRETFNEVARVSVSHPAALRATIASLDRDLDPRWEKLAFHLRHSWPRQRAVAAGPALVDDLAPRLIALAPLVAEINA